MTDYRSLLEHDLRLAGPAGFSFDDLSRRRKRKRRNQRIGAAMLALVVAAVAIGGVIRAFERAETIRRPANLPSHPGDWSRSWLEPTPRSGSVLSITTGGPGLVAVGAHFGDQFADVWTSSNGRRWNHIPGKELGPGEIDGVTSGGPGLVAVGTERNNGAETSSECRGVARSACAPGFHGAVWTSRDGLTWSRAADDATFRGSLMQAVTAGGPGLVAVGLWNSAWFSSDGETWERASVPSVRDKVSLTNVAASGDRLVATGWDKKGAAIWTSTDGMTWTDVPLNADVFPRGNDIADITGGPDGFVAVGSHNEVVPPAVWISADGLHWHRVSSDQDAFVSRAPPLPDRRTSFAIWSVAAGSGGYVAVGVDGYCARGRDCPSAQAAVWTSADGRSWVRVPTGPVFQVTDPLRPQHNRGAEAGSVVPWGSRFVIEGDYDGGQAVWISEPPPGVVGRKGHTAPS